LSAGAVTRCDAVSRRRCGALLLLLLLLPLLLLLRDGPRRHCRRA